MKRKIYLLAITIYIAIAGNCQFIPMPMNYKNPAYHYYPEWMSIVDASTVWIGTRCYNSGGSQGPYSMCRPHHRWRQHMAIRFHSCNRKPLIRSLCALDANTCFYVLSLSNTTNSSIWKTNDGGSSWVKKTTTQFNGSGGFCDFYHAFDENEGVAVGDPTEGYYEIQRTTDGGDTWTRVDESLIPPPFLANGGCKMFTSAVGDNVWFASFKPSGSVTWSMRCYRSTDRGQNWTVSPTIIDDFGNFKMDFSTAQKGVIVDPS